MPSLLEIDRLFINQKAKLIELTNEYAIRDDHGNTVGTIRQEGQSFLRKILRFFTDVDQFLSHTLVVSDAGGQKVCTLHRPAKFFKSRIKVADASDVQVGEIVQQNMIGKIRFDYIGAAGERLGGIRAENWRAWNFSIVDTADQEVARITKKWAGVGKEMFTTADNYLFEVTGSLSGPQRLLALASAAGVDLALKQDSK